MSHSSDLIAQDIEAYLKVHEQKDLLRFLTCGNVDDGKSTLIGRLLYDSKLIYEDQMAAIEKDSQRFNTTDGDFDLALLVDGLQSEREQGITIDVAYRYFSTEKRKFIIADTPGHEQYTRNMVTGASTCDLAIVMVDARYGIQTQTRRHSFICSLLGIKHVIVAINKMDLVEYSHQVYEQIKHDFLQMSDSFLFNDLAFVPLSALNGDNVVMKSVNMDWYSGKTLMEYLETTSIHSDKEHLPFRFPVQYINRPSLDFRGYSGTITSGTIQVGDEIVALPSGKSSNVKSIFTFDGELSSATAGQAITITLTDEIDISRGDMLSLRETLPSVTRHFSASLVWMNEESLSLNSDYIIKCATKSAFGRVINIIHKVDINTLEKHVECDDLLKINEIAVVDIQLTDEMAVDEYQNLAQTGSFIIIDRYTNATVGAGMIDSIHLSNESISTRTYSKAEIELNQYIRAHYPEWGCLPVN